MAKKKDSSERNNDDNNPNASSLYDWISAQYNVEPLISAVRSGNMVMVDEAFGDYNKRVRRLETILEKLARLGFGNGHERFHEFSGHMRDPMKVEELESLAKLLEVDPRIKELKVELASLNTNGFEEEANRIRAMFSIGTDPSIIDNEIKVLTKRIKEKFFEVAFEEEAVPSEPEPSAETKFTAETIFLLHRDGTLLTVKSRKPSGDLDKKLMSRMVMAIKEQMGRAFKEGEHVHSLTYEGHTIILEDSVHAYAAVVIVGEPKPVMYRVILKALQIMEQKLAPEFEAWKGDRNTLDNLDRYTKAIFQALEKLN
jgi:hypothetical protein